MPVATLTHKTTCRLCDSNDLKVVIPYPPTPIADAYIPASRLGEQDDLYPLDLYRCQSCGHIQLCDVVNPEILFGNYTYETSVSLGLVEHFRNYADEITQYISPPSRSLVVEIGSNDGSLLGFFREHDLRVVGVDPAKAIAAKATALGIETIPAFFTKELACRIMDQHGKAFIVTANNVFAHADNMGDIVDGIAELLDRDGIFCFEVSYLPDILNNRLLDTIYHEHLCYHSVKPLQGFLRRHGLELIDFIRVPTKGGSFRGIAQRQEGPRQVHSSVSRQIEYEEANAFDSEEPFKLIVSELTAMKRRLHQLLEDLRSKGGSIAGYGASATVTTLIYYFGLGRYIEYLVDDNPRKYGTFSPGLHLPVFASEALYEKKPDAVIILAWNYAQPILKKHEAFSNAGGKFIIPLPEIKVV